jgi:hypothetical protein
MSTTVIIDISGRPGLPLRALPFVTAWTEASDSIVRALGLEPTVRVEGVIQQIAGRRIDILNKHALPAYRMNPDGTWTNVPHRQWHAVAVELSSLTAKLQADERQEADDENYAAWWAAAVRALPDDERLQGFPRRHRRGDIAVALPLVFPCLRKFRLSIEATRRSACPPTAPPLQIKSTAWCGARQVKYRPAGIFFHKGEYVS